MVEAHIYVEDPTTRTNNTAATARLTISEVRNAAQGIATRLENAVVHAPLTAPTTQHELADSPKKVAIQVNSIPTYDFIRKVWVLRATRTTYWPLIDHSLRHYRSQSSSSFAPYPNSMHFSSFNSQSDSLQIVGRTSVTRPLSTLPPASTPEPQQPPPSQTASQLTPAPTPTVELQVTIEEDLGDLNAGAAAQSQAPSAHQIEDELEPDRIEQPDDDIEQADEQQSALPIISPTPATTLAATDLDTDDTQPPATVPPPLPAQPAAHSGPIHFVARFDFEGDERGGEEEQVPAPHPLQLPSIVQFAAFDIDELEQEEPTPLDAPPVAEFAAFDIDELEPEDEQPAPFVAQPVVQFGDFALDEFAQEDQQPAPFVALPVVQFGDFALDDLDPEEPPVPPMDANAPDPAAQPSGAAAEQIELSAQDIRKLTSARVKVLAQFIDLRENNTAIFCNGSAEQRALQHSLPPNTELTPQIYWDIYQETPSNQAADINQWQHWVLWFYQHNLVGDGDDRVELATFLAARSCNLPTSAVFMRQYEAILDGLTAKK